MYLLIFISLLSSLICYTNSQELCQSTFGFSGRCLALKDCPSLSQDIKGLPLDAIVKLTCGRTFSNDVKICCPPNRINDLFTSTVTPVIRTKAECGINSASYLVPWSVILSAADEEKRELSPLCRGVLISKTDVLTTRECGQNNTLRYAIIGASNHSSLTNVQILPIIGSSFNNVAIIKLLYPVELNEKVQTICIPNSKEQILNHEFLVTVFKQSNKDETWKIENEPASVLYSKTCSQFNIPLGEYPICSYHYMSCDYREDDSFLVSVDPQTSQHYILGIGNDGHRNCSSLGGNPNIRRNIYDNFQWIKDKMQNF